MKIIADKKVREYELTFVLSASLTSAESKKIVDNLAELVVKHKGEVISQADWGKKSLAYTIKKSGKRYTEANFFHWVIKFETTGLLGFRNNLELEQSLLRHLLVLARKTSADREDVVDYELLEEKSRR